MEWLALIKPWQTWVLITSALSVLALLRGECARAEMGFVILVGLLSMQWMKEIFHPQYWWVASFLIWVTAGGVIAANQRQFSGSGGLVVLLLVVSGVCYPIGRFAGESFALGSKALLIADVLGLAALCIVGGPVIVGFFKDFFGGEWGRNNGLGSRFLRGVSGSSSGSSSGSGEASQ